MADVTISVPERVRDLLARGAAAEGVSLPHFLAALADTYVTPEERAAREAESLAILKAFNGYDPSPEELVEHRANFERILARSKADFERRRARAEAEK